MWLIYFVSEVSVVIAIGVAAGFFPTRERRTLVPGWALVSVTNVLAVGLVAILLTKSSGQAGAQVQVYSTRPARIFRRCWSPIRNIQRQRMP